MNSSTKSTAHNARPAVKMGWLDAYDYATKNLYGFGVGCRTRGFKNFRCARALIAGIETMHMIKKGQLDAIKDRASSAANQSYTLAF